MNFLDRFIVNTVTALLRGALALGVGVVYAQMFVLAALLVVVLLFALLAFVKAAFFGV